MAPRKSQGTVARDGAAAGTATRDSSELAPFMSGRFEASQSTSVEWVRAAAEVRAAVMAAHEWPRNIDLAVDNLRRSCGQIEMARKAFYTYDRAGKTITGPSVHLAREALRCWGNMHTGIWELDRRAGWSEMMAFAVDLQTNARFASTFRVLHVVERSERYGGNRPLGEEEARDIYELNTNMASRRQRETIKDALPAWFMAIAEAECKRTMIDLGDDDSREEFGKRVQTCVELFGSGDRFAKVPQAALESKIGAPRDVWTTHDLLTLRVLYEALKRGELRPETEFATVAGAAGGAANTALAKAAESGPPAGQDDTQSGSGQRGETPRPGRPGATAPRGAAPPGPQGPASAGEAFDSAEPPGGEPG